MILVNEVLQYRVCLECRDVMGDEPEEQWLREHMQPAHAGNRAPTRRRRRRRCAPPVRVAAGPAR